MGRRYVLVSFACSDRSSSISPVTYYLCAVPDFDPNVASDPAFLEPLIAASATVTIAEGEKKKQALKLAGRF